MNEIMKIISPGIVPATDSWHKVRITKEMSEKLLKYNTNNRALNTPRVNQYAHEMSSGEWDDATTSSIIFDTNNMLKDGQHRLEAIVAAGEPRTFWVLVDAEPGGYMFDRGMGRSPRDAVAAKGIDMTSDEVSCARGAYKIVTGKNPSVHWLLYFSEKYASLLTSAVEVGKTGRSNKVSCNRSTYASALFAISLGAKKEELREFFRCANSNETETDNKIIEANGRSVFTARSGKKIEGDGDIKKHYTTFDKALYATFIKGKVIKRYVGDDTPLLNAYKEKFISDYTAWEKSH